MNANGSEYFSCGHCNIIILTVSALKDHLLEVHSKSKQGKSFQCEKCPKHFARDHDLKYHVMIDHQSKPCDKAFKNQTKRMHLKEELLKKDTTVGSRHQWNFSQNLLILVSKCRLTQ